LVVSFSSATAIEISDGFNYPVGSRNPGAVTAESDGDGWYNAQDWGEFNTDLGGLHSGEDWNNEGGGASDVGNPVYAVSHGEVVGSRPVTSRGGASVGSVLVLRHILLEGQVVYSLYWHINVIAGLQGEIRRDQQIGTIADIRPALFPHLHFEIRTTAVNLDDLYLNDRGNGYYDSFEALQADGFTLDPSDFIDAHRPISNSDSRSCHTFTSSSTIPQGFGVPWNVFDPTQLLLRASCTSSSVTADVGPATYIYNQGYAFVNNQWQGVTFNCTGGQLVSNAWCPQSAQGTLPNTATQYLAFTCNWTGTKWNCGCRDQQCSQSFWQLQGIQR
jgi:murein DD-endopeptidase MepM/ murein hydrolase activator NlpD